MHTLFINTDFIKLSQALKLATNQSGAFAKLIIFDGQVKVNGVACTLRGKKIYNMDIIEISDNVEGLQSRLFQVISKV